MNTINAQVSLLPVVARLSDLHTFHFSLSICNCMMRLLHDLLQLPLAVSVHVAFAIQCAKHA